MDGVNEDMNVVQGKEKFEKRQYAVVPPNQEELKKEVFSILNCEKNLLSMYKATMFSGTNFLQPIQWENNKFQFKFTSFYFNAIIANKHDNHDIIIIFLQIFPSWHTSLK